MRNAILLKRQAESDPGVQDGFVRIMSVGARALSLEVQKSDFYDVSYLKNALGISIKNTPKIEEIQDDIARFTWKSKNYTVERLREKEGRLEIIGTRL